MNKGVLMANYQTTVRRGVDARAAAQINEGLRAYMNKVYALMGVAMIITGLVAYVIGADFANLVSQQPTLIVPESVLAALFSSPLRWVVIFAPLAMVFLKKNLSGWGSFLIMGLIGLIVASIANIFIESSALGFAVSVIGVLIFAGLTAYDTQRLKNEYLHFSQMGPEGAAYLEKGSIMGALGLYLNFINMFMFLLQFMGAARE